MKLYDTGVYLLNGQKIVPENQADFPVSKEEAAKSTIAYSILKAHNTSGNMEKLQIKFDKLTSHDITFVGIIQTARASGLEKFPVPYVLTNCHNSLCAVGGTINEDDHMFGLTCAKKYGGVYVPPHQAVIHQFAREMLAAGGKMILGSDSHTRYGALGTMAMGEGGPELVKQLLSQTYDINMPGVVAIYLTGSPRPGVGPQDVALAIIGKVFANGYVKNKVMEFVGPGVSGLSADFRIKDVKKYEKWYGIEHKAPQFIDEAVYGLCEINREDIKKARLIANPGCYPTCSTLSIYPLLKEGLIDPNTIIIDAKSGTSGAGRGAKVANLYCEVNENIKAYGVATHRHTPEIEDQLGYACGQEVLINFTPHLIPMNRGILITAYASLKKEVSYEEVKAVYDKYYENETFVRVLDKDVCPQTKCVEGSNYVDVNFKIDPRTKRVIMMGAMDNLVKGAAGQAVQNMNLMFGFDEAEGLHQIPMLP